MKKTILFLIILFCGHLIISAQTYVDIPWREGVIIKKGEELPGMIRLGGDLGAPYLNNEKVYFVEEKNWDENRRKPKKKYVKEYKAKDLDGYQTYTETEDGKRIEMNFSTYEVKVRGAIKMKNAKAFLKSEIIGPVNVYSYVPKPTKSLLASQEERYEDRQRALAHSTIYLEKGDNKLEKASDSELVEMLKECPEVVEKIKNESYGFKPLSERPKKKGLKKFISNAVGDNPMELKIMQAIKDYNKCVTE